MVVLSRAVRERSRVGTRPDHGQLVAVRLCPGGGRQRRRGAGAHGRLLRGVARVQVGVVPAALRAARLGAVAAVGRNVQVGFDLGKVLGEWVAARVKAGAGGMAP